MNGYPVEGSGFEDEVGEELFAPVVPYVFGRVELRRIWRQGPDRHVFLDAEAADAFLRLRGIITRRMAGYGLADSMRITIGLEDEMRAVAAALKEFLG